MPLRPGESPDPYDVLGEPTDYLGVIHELAIEILRVESLDDLAWLLAKSTISKLGFEDCVIYLRDAERDVLVQRAAFGPKSPEGTVIVNPIEITPGSGIVGTVAMTGEPLLVDDVLEDGRYIVDDEARRSELAVPILHEGRAIGVIDSEHSEVGFFSEELRDLLTIIASMASTKIATALTIERLNATVVQLEGTRNALRQEEQRFRDLYNKHPSMFFTVSAGGRVVSTNEYACRQLGFELDEIEGRPFSELVEPTGELSVEEEMAACLEALESVHRWEGSIRNRAGQEIWLRLSARGMAGEAGAPGPVLVVAEDVTETRILSKELEYNATHDWLTGLYNRREFERRLSAAVREGRRHGVEYTLCFVDLDQFKVVNDTCGHGAGDTLLRHVSRVLESHVRKSDLVGRIGGDEFGILMRNCGLADARRSATKLLDSLASESFRWDTHVFSIGASIGIASLALESGDFDEVLFAADAACLSAKEQGRNRVHIYRERDADIARRKGEARWVSRLTKSLAENAFELFGQRIQPLDPSSDDIEHVEILLRMRDADRSLILPGAFIPAAERYGLTVRIDMWVMHHALRWIADVEVPRSPARCWAINLSGATIGDPEFLDFLIDGLRSTGVAPRSLCFEITETAAIADLMRARRFVERLKELGCRFALDDFGSGLSSLAYLKTFPVDLLKIDGVFVKEVDVDPVSRAMVSYINDIGHLTGKKTVAEFVHTEALLATVAEIGVDFAQGHAVSEAVPLDTFR